MSIHPKAVVSDEAVLDPSVEVGANVIIEGPVRIDAGTKIYPNAYITGKTVIGKNNLIHVGAILGTDPQDHSFDSNTDSGLILGDNNIVREYATIHRGSKPGANTVLGDHNMIMTTAHIGHDVTIGNHCNIATFAGIAGHCTVGDYTFMSGGVVIHQFVSIGRFAIISGDSGFSRNIPPFCVAMARNMLGPINLVGLRRAGFKRETIQELKLAHRKFFYSELPKNKALDALEAEGFTSPEVKEFIDFIRHSKRPIAHHYQGTKEKDNV